MLLWFSGLIAPFFYLLFFAIPLAMWTKTSELFEFNKIIVLYVLTILIIASWVTKTILAKKIIFRRTILDIPLLIFLASQILATTFSIDIRTSILGYYSRWNGGLLSTISYLLLYWAYVANMDYKKTLCAMHSALWATFLVCVYGIAEHFGIDKNLWVQDVQNRVFSTFGQPNWLAAWLVAVIPITWTLTLNHESRVMNYGKNKKIPKIFGFALSLVFFLTLLFTKSRSGLLGFAIEFVLFWTLIISKLRANIKNVLSSCIIHTSLFIILIFAVGSPWTPNITSLMNHPPSNIQDLSTNSGPALEGGGTESGIIRRIVWQGAIDIWKHYPILGTGVETFAYSYYWYRPITHNMVSEWDFLYNKAHNEYLNFAATTGSVGLTAYLLLITFSIFQVIKIKDQKLSIKITNQNSKIESEKFLFFDCHFDFYYLNFALLAGYASILVTNFFGFSVVPVSLLFFLIPAIAETLRQDDEKVKEYKIEKIENNQKITLITFYSFTLLLFYSTVRYWYADTLYARGREQNLAGNFPRALDFLIKADAISPAEPLYLDETANSQTEIALSLAGSQKDEEAKTYAAAAIQNSLKATEFSPKNLNLKRSQASYFIKLSAFEPKLMDAARQVLTSAVALAPTDPKLTYSLGITYMRLGEVDQAKLSLEKAITLKPDYKNPRQALGLLLIQIGDKEGAANEFNYILTEIDPNDEVSKNQLQNLNK